MALTEKGREMLTVEAFELIRRMVLVDKKSQREVAAELGHSRKTVKKALEHPAPPPYQIQQPRAKPALEPVREVIDAWLEEDQGRPPKQRHTAQRIFERLQQEPHHYQGSYSTVQRYVAQHKAQRSGAEVFVPLTFSPGQEAQVDWGEAQVIVAGQQRKAQFFCLKLAYSKRVFVRAYERANLESFLDGHVRALAFLGGVPQRLAYDNLKTAVTYVGRGRQRTLNRRFVELRSCYLFQSRFCNVAKGNEKGHVENLVQRVQRNFLTPLPEAASLEELNARLLEDCQQELRRSTREGTSHASLWEGERAALLPLPAAGFDAFVEVNTRADKHSLVRFDRCWYSVPVRHAHQRCQVRGFADRVQVHCQHECVAEHRRSHASEQHVVAPWHYVPLLARKPGALLNGRPFAEEALGPDFALLQRELEHRQGEAGTRQYIRILLLTQEHPVEQVCQAVSVCVRRRAFDEHAIRHMLRQEPPPRAWSRLDLSDRPQLHCASDGVRPASIYDALLGGVAGDESAEDSATVDEPAADGAVAILGAGVLAAPGEPSATPWSFNPVSVSVSASEKENADESHVVVGKPPQNAQAADDAA